MVDETKVVEDLSNMTDEEKAEAWAKWIRSEVNSALDIYLPVSKEGFVQIQYSPHVIEVLETGPVYHTTKMDAVRISLIFEFENPVDLSKPRIENE
jgi:hypothetical protein